MEFKKGIHSVLCATDFSEESDKAVEFAVSLLSLEKDVNLHLLHIVKPIFRAVGDVSYATDLLIEENETMIKDAKRKIELLASEIRENGFSKVHGSVRGGDPVNGILYAIEEFKADLVIMGTRKHGFKKGILLGSVSERVAADSPVSVLIVR